MTPDIDMSPGTHWLYRGVRIEADVALLASEMARVDRQLGSGRITLGDDPLTHTDNTPKLRASKTLPWRTFEGDVIAFARLHGWRVAHFRPAETAQGWRTPVQGDKGFVDLVLAKGGVVHHWELKSGSGKPDADQVAWGAALGDSYRLFSPADWPEIQELLVLS